MLRAASERLGIPRLAEHPRTLLINLLERSGCDTDRCMALMCACEDENIQRMSELWDKLTPEEKEQATVDDLAHALEIKIADILPVISKEIIRMAKFEADVIVGLHSSNVVEHAINRSLGDEKGSFNYAKMVLEIGNIVPVPKSKVQIHVGNIDAREQKQLNQVVIPSLEEVTRSLEERKPIPGIDPKQLDE